jgi:hypothetical protein
MRSYYLKQISIILLFMWQLVYHSAEVAKQAIALCQSVVFSCSVDRSRILFSIKILFAASELTLAVRLTALFWSTNLCEKAFNQSKIIKSKYRCCLTEEHWKYCIHLFQNKMDLLSLGYLKICNVIHKLHNRKLNEESLNILICFILKRSIFNKWNCIYVLGRLISYFTFVCLVHIQIHYFLSPKVFCL